MVQTNEGIEGDSMAYQALYRKWRPKVFEDVVGQEPVVTTLKNQIKTGRISHAYLFTGTRGTGKTSTAKIFARAVNCLHPIEANPCNECEVCQGILSESMMDVMEIDAASNNGVDHIREIRENVKYTPSKGKYKVYIIDEVHMLSGGAFNALLKTLEEPPAHVIFILATTEVHKLPATILSRCQRFDFKPVKLEAIVQLMTRICQSMGIAFEEQALKMIAQNARGGLRDSLSILEQCISFSKETLTYEGVMETLGLTNEEILYQLTEAVAEGNAGEALSIIQQLVQGGKDILLLIKDWIQYFRQLLLIKLKVPGEVFFSTQDFKAQMEAQSSKFSEGTLTRCMLQLSDGEARAKYASQPQVILEVVAVTLCRPEADTSLEGLETRIQALERALARGGMPAFREDNLMDRPKTQSPRAISQSTATATAPEMPGPRDETRSTPKVAKKPQLQGEGATPDLAKIQEKWQEILEVLRQNKKAQIKAFLMEGQPVRLKGNQLIVSFKDGFGFHREALDKDKNKEIISEVIAQVTGQRLTLSFVMEYDLIQTQPQEIDPVEKLQAVLPKGMLEIIEE